MLCAPNIQVPTQPGWDVMRAIERWPERTARVTSIQRLEEGPQSADGAVESTPEPPVIKVNIAASQILH